MYVAKNTNVIDLYLILCIKKPMAHLEIKFPKELDIKDLCFEINMLPRHRKDNLEEEKIKLKKIIGIIEDNCNRFLNVETLEIISKYQIIEMLKDL